MYCPLFSIAFDPPKKGEPDNRLCKSDCSWYNLTEDDCNINVIANNLTNIETLTDDILNAVAETSLYKSFDKDYDDYDDPGDIEEEEYYSSSVIKGT